MLQALTLLLTLVSTFADNNLNIGLIDDTHTVDSANVVSNGSPKSHDQWDPAPFSDLSTYSSPTVSFALWNNDLPGAAPSEEISVSVTLVAPNGGKDTNYAKCGTPTFTLDGVASTTGTIKKIPQPEVNATSLRLSIFPQVKCTQPGQSQVYITITTASDTTPLAQIYFVTTSGNPIDIGTTIGGSDIASQGVVENIWDPIHLKDNTADQLFSVTSHKLDILFYLHIPKDRAQDGANPLVLGNEDGVTLPGTPEDRQLAHCTAAGIVKACSAKIVAIPASPQTDGGIWEQQASVNAGLDFSLHLEYGCETNGYVDLLIEIPLKSGFAPISFAWRKACERSPGLAIATDIESVLADPDVAQDGTVRPMWDASNTTVRDRDGDADDKTILTERIFYFWVNPKGVNVKAANFASTNYTSSPHPKKGATDLICKPVPKWEIASNFNKETATCSNGNKCQWSAVGNVHNGVPADPLEPGAAPLRVVFSYADCSGQGAVRLDFEMKFGAFDLIRVGWYKYLGTPPGLTLGCQSGCPPVPGYNSSSNAVVPIVTNGHVQNVWSAGNGPIIDNRILQSSWFISADSKISDYDFSIENIDSEKSSQACTLDYSGDVAPFFVKGSWTGIKQVVPGTVLSFDLVYVCTPGNDHKDTFTLKIKFTNYKSITVVFTKLSTYSSYVFIGTSATSKTEEENVNAQGSPGKAWKTPESSCTSTDQDVRDQGCTLDAREHKTRQFYISYRAQAGAPGSAVIPAPPSSLDPAKQYPGVHSSYFFTYNSSNMFGCSPYWDVSQKGMIKDRFDFVKQGKAVISSTTPPLVLTIDYNCSNPLARCLKPGACASLFTGFVPIDSMGCDSAHPASNEPCAYPMFRWIKTVAPVAPYSDGLNLGWSAYTNGGNITWNVPDSGDGADDVENQRIRTYNFTLLNEVNKYKVTYVLYVNHSKYLQTVGKQLQFSVNNLTTGVNYHLWLNVTNEAGLSTEVDRIVSPGSPSGGGGGLAPGITALIAIVVGIIFVVGACCMYHSCIKGNQKNAPEPLLSVVQSSQSTTQQRQLPEEDPYNTAPAQQSSYSAPMDSDADNMLKNLLAEN